MLALDRRGMSPCVRCPGYRTVARVLLVATGNKVATGGAPVHASGGASFPHAAVRPAQIKNEKDRIREEEAAKRAPPKYGSPHPYATPASARARTRAQATQPGVVNLTNA